MQAAAAAQQTRMTADGQAISASAIQRLEKKRKYSKDLYDSLKINQLTNHGKEEDPARRKKEDQQLLDLRRQIKQFDAQILEIRLALKDSMWRDRQTQWQWRRRRGPITDGAGLFVWIVQSQLGATRALQTRNSTTIAAKDRIDGSDMHSSMYMREEKYNSLECHDILHLLLSV